MEERRRITRVAYPAPSVIVDCQTQQRYVTKAENVSPLGMGIRADASIPNLVGKDVIVVAATMIMYADVVRQDKQEDGTYMIGVNARKFTDDVLEYLFESIGKGDAE
ncbi:MAG: PilZ domain-containing protein [Lachnospiraceae bacterium]|nr:PilZ domain-containing protein [Lachnospiraceae bacterium]